jgi:hypothetical protein
VAEVLDSIEHTCLHNGLTRDAAEQSILGSDVEFVINAYDEMNTVIPVADIIRRFKMAADVELSFS